MIDLSISLIVDDISYLMTFDGIVKDILESFEEILLLVNHVFTTHGFTKRNNKFSLTNLSLS